MAAGPPERARAVAQVFREESARILASLIRVTGDFELAEDAMQEAFALALEAWEQSGIPARPGAWITTTARRKAIDRLRRDRSFREKRDVYETLLRMDAESSRVDPMAQFEAAAAFGDDRLRLIFTCCHPALAPEARVALTLRTVCGLTTGEIARAFLVPDSTMAQRIVRAKRKIRIAGIPYEIPEPGQWPERIAGVSAVLYLIFNEGYSASGEDRLVREDLCREAIRLARLLVTLAPAEAEVRGLLALMLLQDARRRARTDADGALVTLEEQDRSLWDRRQIFQGLGVLQSAAALGRPGPYQIQAAIAAQHALAPRADATDWPRIVRLYDRLLEHQPSPVIELNRAVAVAMADGAASGLALLDELAAAGSLDRYHLFHAARGDLLRRLGRAADAVPAYRTARALCSGAVERDYLNRRIEELTGDGAG